jgi:alpha,alpha-trehalase
MSGADLRHGNCRAGSDDALLERVRGYIKKSWTTLTRSNQDLPNALPDPKMPHPRGQPWLLYIAPGEARERIAPR